jgi:hypothetical protein
MAAPLFRFYLSQANIGTVEVNAPVGWDDIELTLARDAVYHGVSASYTLDLQFEKVGYEFIRTVYNTYGIEAEILLLVYELDINEKKYVGNYAGRVNLTKYAATEIDCTVNAEETGFVRAILNSEDIQVNLISLKSLSGVDIAKFENELQAIELHSKATQKLYEANSDVNQPQFTYSPATREEETSGTVYIGFDTEVSNQFSAYTYTTGVEFTKGTNAIIDFVEEGEVTVEYDLDFEINCYADKGDFKQSELDFFIGVGLKGQPVNGTPVPSERIFSDSQSGLSGFFSKSVRVSGKRVYNIKAGESLYLFGYTGVFDTDSPTIGTFQFSWQMELTGLNRIKVSGATTTEPSQANGIMIHEAFSRIVQSITGRDDAFYSELLGRTDSNIKYPSDGELSLLWLSNGSQIRGFPLADTVFVAPTWDAGKQYAPGELVSFPVGGATYIATSANQNDEPTRLVGWQISSVKPIAVLGRPIFAALKEAYGAINALRPVGLGAELLPTGAQRIRFEGVEFFYNKTVALELGAVEGLKLSVAQEYYYNQVDAGFEKWQSGEDNSLDEYNTKQSRITPITQLKSTYSMLCKYPMSGYLIEGVRRQQYKDTPDKEDGNDKTNFLVALLRRPVGSGFETERNQKLIICNNVNQPSSIYNARYTPFRNFIRHGVIIRSGLRFLDAKSVLFQEGNANYNAQMQFQDEPAPLAENQPMPVSGLSAPIWIPEYYEFTAPLPRHQRLAIQNNPYGLITFRDRIGNLKKGYIKEIKMSLSKKQATFKLLRAA